LAWHRAEHSPAGLERPPELIHQSSGMSGDIQLNTHREARLKLSQNHTGGNAGRLRETANTKGSLNRS